MGFITVISDNPRIRNSSECWGRGKQKGAFGGIPHPAKDHGSEVGEGVDADCAGHEEEGVDPDLPLQEGVHDLGGGDVVVFCVAAVGVETVFYDLDFFWGKEGASGFVDFVGEVDDEPEAHEGECDGDEAFNDLGYVRESEACLGREGTNKDPSPSAVAGCAVQLVDCVGEEVAEAAGEEVDGVEDRDAFLDLIAFIP